MRRELPLNQEGHPAREAARALARKVDRFREMQGISLRTLSQKLDVDQVTLRRHLTGETMGTLAALVGIAEAVGLEVVIRFKQDGEGA